MTTVIQLKASEHSIKSVTVFKSSKAEVVRSFSLDLKAGLTKIEITGLPTAIDTQSVRVSGLGEARLSDVVCTLGNNKSALDASVEAIRILRAKKVTLESERRVREHEADILVNYAKTLNGEHVSPSQMAQFLESFVEQGRKNLEGVAVIGGKIVEIDRLIEAEAFKTSTRKGSLNGEATIVVGTDSATKLDLLLTYIVHNASWEPTYELHATTENGKPSSKVSLHYRARVTQSTGEDWKGTTLTVSTVASDVFAKTIPKLPTYKIRPQATTFGQPKFGQTAAPSTWGARGGSGGSLFGNGRAFDTSNAPTNTTTAFGMMNRNANVAPPSFGSAAPTTAGLFGSRLPPSITPLVPNTFSAFGQSQQQPQQQFQQQAQQQAQPPITTSTVNAFNEAVAGLAIQNVGPVALPASTSEEVQNGDSFEEIALPSGGEFGSVEPATIITETPLAISYSVESKSTIPSDGVAHQVSIAVLPFEGKVSHVAIPRIDPRVYLQCQVKNTSEYRLLPGPVSVILDDSFVSKTSINDINTGDTFDCALGDDAATKVTYTRSGRTVRSPGGAFSEVVNTTTYTTKITIHNKHAFALADLRVRDIVPMSDDKRVKVILRKPAGLADAKDGQVVDVKSDGNQTGLQTMWEKAVDGSGGEKEGRYEWKWKVDGGAKVTFEAEWEIKAPADLQLVEASVAH